MNNTSQPPQSQQSTASKWVGVRIDGATREGCLILLEHHNHPELTWRGLIPWQMLQSQSAMSIAGLVADAWYTAKPELAEQPDNNVLALTMMVALVLTPEGEALQFNNKPVLPADFSIPE